MAFVHHPMDESKKSLREYASPRYEDIKVQESDSKLEATKYEIKARIIKMAVAIDVQKACSPAARPKARHFGPIRARPGPLNFGPVTALPAT
jgi:hypothetical protein